MEKEKSRGRDLKDTHLFYKTGYVNATKKKKRRMFN